MNETKIFQSLGSEGFTKITHAFYQRVKTDDLLSPMYPHHDWDGAEERLRDFLLFRFGANPRYLETRGHPQLRARHLPFKIGLAERDRWLLLMNQALTEVETPTNIHTDLMAFFSQVADFMRNQPE